MKKTITLFVAILLASISFAQHANDNSLKGSLGKNKIEATQQFQRHKSLDGQKSTTHITATTYLSTQHDNGWMCILSDAQNNYTFYFDILATTLDPGTTYTLGGMGDEHSYGYNNAGDIIYDSASFTLSITSGIISINARVVDANGDVYNITYQQFDPADATDTIDVVCTSVNIMDRFSTNGYTFINPKNSLFEFGIYLYNPLVTGTYGTGTIYAVLYKGNSPLTYAFRTGDIRIKFSATGYNIEGNIVFSDSNCYHITVEYPDNHASVDTANVTGDTIELAYSAEQTHLNNVTSESGNFIFFGLDDNTQTSIAIRTWDNTIHGDYYNDIATYATYIVDRASGASVTAQLGHVNIRDTEEGYFLEGMLYFDDGNCYHITMAYHIPTAAEVIDLPFTKEEVTLANNIESQGKFTFTGRHNNTTAKITILGNTIPGIYTSEIDTNATGIWVSSGNNAEVYHCLSGKVTIIAFTDGYFVDAYLNLEDSSCYHITMNNHGYNNIDSPSRVSMKAYPNPTSNILNVEAEGLQHVTLMDVNGRQVMSQQSSTIDMSALPNGVYFLRAITVNGIATQKVIKK